MKPLIISLGHSLRGDDGVGPTVLKALRPALEEQADFVECQGDTAALLQLWQDRQRVFLIDACSDGGAEAGKIYRLDGLAQALPPDPPSASNHALGLTSTIELGRRLGALPRALTIYSVAGKNFALGAALAPEVERAAATVARAIVNEVVNEIATGDSPCMNTRC